MKREISEMNAIRMTVILLVVSLLITGVASAADIKAEQLRESFAIIDRALEITDVAVTS